MPKKLKLKTPEWILEGYNSEDDYLKATGKEKRKKGKTFKVKKCPKCGSDDVGVLLSGSDSEEGGGNEWKCHKCKWKGEDIIKKELTEDELMEYMDSKEGGEE